MVWTNIYKQILFSLIKEEKSNISNNNQFKVITMFIENDKIAQQRDKKGFKSPAGGVQGWKADHS